MTMWGKFIRRRELTGLQFEQIPAGDGDDLMLASAESPASGPVLLLLHGLEGGLRSHYVSGIWALARRNGWQPTVLLFRTCDGRMNRARRTYHSGETTDLDLIVRHLILEDPTRPIGLAGISLGANVMLKWLGEKGDGVPEQLRATIAVSTPYDLARSSRAIDSGFARLYQWNFLRSLRKKARLKVAQHPDICSVEGLDTLTTMWEFDDRFTAPLHGFRDAADYYAQCSSIRFLVGIRRPTLLLSARDDPFNSDEVLRDVEEIAGTNPYVHVEFHRRGGHVGFVGGTPWHPAYYVESRVGSFLAPHLGTSNTTE
ncbi:MAG TPA: alpha/beta fold hydrolase [Gemmatimonadaceae bacterium]